MANSNRTTSTPRGASVAKATAGMDAYDQASLAITNVACAARLLLSSSPDEHTSKLGHDDRDFLLSSILDNAKVADEALDVLTPYTGDAARTEGGAQ